MSVDDPKDLEEERRLFYVAVTRAEKQVYLCFAATRYRYGKLENPRPSRFIREIDNEYLDWISINNRPVSNGYTRHKSTYSQKGYQKSYLRNTLSNKSGLNWAPAGKVKLSRSNFNNLKTDDPVNIQPGMTVEHNNFGIGNVISLEGVYPDTRATVSFQNHGKKKLLLRFAKLKIVNN
jgi:DNA helicase-2/ATP-dependent DNA helicase PcrA